MIRTCSKGHVTGFRFCPQCGNETTPTKVVVIRKEDDKEERTVRELRRMGRI